MNSTANVFHFQPSAHQDWPGTTPTVVHQPATSAHLDHTTTESSVFHTLHVIAVESGMILSVNASAHKVHSPTEPFAFDALLVNFTPTEDATAQMEPSSMELNAPSELSTNVSAFQTPIGTELIVFASQVTQQTVTHAIVMVSLSETSVKDVPPSQTLSGLTESVNATTALLMLMVCALLLLPSQLNAMSELSSTVNSKNVFHALTDALLARPVTTVLNVDPITLLMPNLDFVLKYVVMERDTLLNAMMETTSMVMDVAEIAELKSAPHATVVHQPPEIAAAPFSHQPFQSKTEVNQDFTERSF